MVVQKQAGVTIASTPDAPLSTLQIAPPAIPAVELPDLKDCWAWAHAQVAPNDQQEIGSALNGAPELSLSRLVCPRILAPDTDYIACVVPTFELGRKAGLGLPIRDSDLTAANALASAWSFAPAAPAQVLLPVYYHWEFRTGQTGDFESLVLGLTSEVPEGLGKRPIDISQPGFPLSGGTTVDLEGALLPIAPPPPVGTPPPAPWPDPIAPQFQSALAPIINEPSRSQAADPNADPLLAPPIYGRWHAGKASVTPAGATWLDQLNLDPRWRVAAAFGTRVVQEHQEALMASAWEQAAELPNANQRMRQLQLSMAVGEIVHARHFATLSEEMVLRIAAPAFGRLRQGTATVAAGPTGKLSTAGGGKPLGDAPHRASARTADSAQPISRRKTPGLERRTPGWPGSTTWGEPFPHRQRRRHRWTTARCPVCPTSTSSTTTRTSARSSSRPRTRRCDVAWCTAPGAGHDRNPGVFPQSRASIIARFFAPPVAIPPRPHFIISQDFKGVVVKQTDPRVALRALVKAILSTGDNVLAPNSARRHAHRRGNRDVGAVLSAADVRAPARPVAGTAAAGARQGQARDCSRPEDQSALCRGLHGRAQPRNGTRAAVARLPDRSARHLLRPLLGSRRAELRACGHQRPEHLEPTVARRLRGRTGR